MALSTLILAGALLPFVAGSDCTCYLTNGTTPAYFTSYVFHDFRTIDHSLTASPSAITSDIDTTNAPITSDYFSSDDWTNTWNIQNWNTSDSLGNGQTDASVLMINSQNNVYIENAENPTDTYKTHLTLRTTRLEDFQSVSEIDSVDQNYHYVSMRLLARVIGSPGACAGTFTYLLPDSTTKSGQVADQFVQEADIEILTTGPRNRVQYTNQPSVDADGNVLDQATVNGTMPDNLDWSTWNTYRLDWTEGKSVWYVNGQQAAEISFQAPKDPAGLILNMWSDGGGWTGNMSINDYAYFQIQWLEVIYNTSGPANPSKRDETAIEIEKELSKRKDKEKGCQVVCSVDTGTDAASGNPVVVANNTGSATSFRIQAGGLDGSLIWGLVIGVLGVAFL